MIDIINGKVGIWGLGIVGQSVLRLLLKKGCTNVSVMDQRPVADIIQSIIQQPVTWYHQQQAENFFAAHDYIISSPGIDIRSVYPVIKDKLVSELDLFSLFFQKKIVAITGTVGKTSITSLLHGLLQRLHVATIMGGNIGIGSCDLLAEQDNITTAVLETSDVQLKYCKQFAPDLAIWTNFSENHLDWHGTMDHYFDAKVNILAHQHEGQQALIPLEIAPRIRQHSSVKNQSLHFFTTTLPENDVLATLRPGENLYILDGSFIKKVSIDKDYATLMSVANLPNITYPVNWLILVAALDLLQLPLEHITSVAYDLSIPSHRFESIGTINHVEFYNDSKATTMTATYAAIDELSKKNRPIILFLGGLSKGVDRTDLIKACKNRIKTMYCFGKEAVTLATIAHEFAIPASAYVSLEEAFSACLKNLSDGDQVLFSPAGSSFDLFENYQARGNLFKELVQSYKQVSEHPL